MDDYLYVYLHGSVGGPDSPGSLLYKKALEEHGFTVHNLSIRNGKAPGDARVSDCLDCLDEFYDKHKKKMRIVGFSMGGMMAALYASKYPDKVDKLALQSPVFNLKDNWQIMLEYAQNDKTAMERWKRDGKMEFKVWSAEGEPGMKPVDISYAYVEESLTHPSYPKVSVPTLIFVGKEDKTIAPNTGYVFQLEQDNPEIVTIEDIDDGHGLLKPETVKQVCKRIAEFFN